MDWWERAWLRHPGVAERFQVVARASLPFIHDADGNTAQVFFGA